MISLCTAGESGIFRPQFIRAEVIDGKMQWGKLPTSYGDCQTLIIAYEDATSHVALKQYFTVYSDSDVIATSVALQNNGEGVLSVRNLASLQLDLPDGVYEITTLDGVGCAERTPHKTTLASGTHSVSSVSGMSSNNHNPFMMLSSTKRDYVVATNLIWSGNHKESAQRSAYGGVRVATGLNGYMLNYPVQSGETFYAPEAVFTFALREEDACRNLRLFTAEHVVRGVWKNKPRPVLANSWESFIFQFDRARLMDLCDVAATVGIELFVLDDGWFGERNDDHRSLGDWTANKNKLGGSLKSLADDVRSRGIQFGIWVEPEMVNRDSNLFRAHPEYALLDGDREPIEIRQQIVLDLSKDEVRDYIVDAVSAVIDESGAQYIKWDCNRGVFELTNASKIFYDHTIGLYDVLRRLTEKYPEVLFESCASGGNRYDLGMLCFTPQIWASDNTDPFDRLPIQQGTLMPYPQATMGAHVGHSPNHHTGYYNSLFSRFAVASIGAFGYEFNLALLDEKGKAEIRSQTAFYKVWRDVLQFGAYYPLESRLDGNLAAWMAVSSDQSRAVATVVSTRTPVNAPNVGITFAGLDENAEYSVRIYEDLQAEPKTFTARGDILTNGVIDLGAFHTQMKTASSCGSIAPIIITFHKN